METMIVINITEWGGENYSILCNGRYSVGLENGAIVLIHASQSGQVTRRNIQSFSVKPFSDCPVERSVVI